MHRSRGFAVFGVILILVVVAAAIGFGYKWATTPPPQEDVILPTNVSIENHADQEVVQPSTTTATLPKGMTAINDQYAKDATSVYYLQDDGTGVVNPEKLPGVDPRTFHIVGICGESQLNTFYYAADAHTVVGIDTPIAGADPASFALVGTTQENTANSAFTGTYAKDGSKVYKDCGEVMQGVAPSECAASDLSHCESKAPEKPAMQNLTPLERIKAMRINQE